MRKCASFGVVLLLAAVILGIAAQGAFAQYRLIGTLGYGGTPSTLVEINPETAELVGIIGPVGYCVNGLVYDPTTCTLYGGTSLNDPLFNGLIVIDPFTGAGTPVGLPGWGGIDFPAVTNITVNSAGEMYGWWEGGDDLVSIDKTTGTATAVGESGVGTLENALDFNADDVLHMVNSGGTDYIVDPMTGFATYDGDIGSTAHHGCFDPGSGLFYGLTWNIPYRDLVIANLETDELISVTPSVDELHTLEFLPVDPSAVEQNSWGRIKAQFK